MGDIVTGHTFAAGESVTHATLNSAVNDATIGATLITGRSAASAVVPGDSIPLISTTDSNAFRKATLTAAVFDNAALLTDRASAAAVVKEDAIFLKDVSEAAPGYRKATLQAAVFENAELIQNRTALTTPAGTEELLVREAAGTFKRITRDVLVAYDWPSYILLSHTGLVAHTTPIAADHLMVWDYAGEANKKITLGNLLALSPATIARADADLLLMYDTSEETTHKLTLAELKAYVANVGVTKSAVQAANAMSTYSYVCDIAHTLGAMPQSIRVVAVCTDAGGDAGYAQNDEVDIQGILALSGGIYYPGFSVYADATNVSICRQALPKYMVGKTSGNNTAMDESKWKLKAYSILVS